MIPATKPDGEFHSFQHWVNHATSYIGGMNALCADSKDRRCSMGSHFMRARDEETYPIRFWYDYGGETKAQKKKSMRNAKATLKANYPWRY